MKTLQGKRALITGASRGFGAEMARVFLEAGANVVICARDERALAAVAQELKSKAAPDQAVLAVRADVAVEEDVRHLMAEVDREWGGLDILVNNAGVQGPMGKLHLVDMDEWWQAVQINLRGAVLMCKHAIPLFLRQGRGRIIQLSGGGATGPRPFISAYAASKAALVRLVETVAEEYREQGICINAIAPGAMNTKMLEEVLAAGPEKVGEACYRGAVAQKEKGGVPMRRAADLAVFLATDGAVGITGRLISAVWDPWEKLAEAQDRLMKTDVYTLRRIVPEDRGLQL